MSAKVGDTVRFLNSVGGGKVVRIVGQMAYVDDDGFETPVLLRECVVVMEQKEKFSFPKEDVKVPGGPAKNSPADFKPVEARPVREELPPVEESPEGEKLNVVLGFEPSDIKRLSGSSFDVSIVNDSNFMLHTVISTRKDNSNAWDLKFSGIIEPAIQEFLFELNHDDLPDLDRISVQIIPFKTTGPYTLKKALSFEKRLDTTKFAKLHCFGPNPYFDNQVIALDIVKDDVVQQPYDVDATKLQAAMNDKKRVDARPSAKKVSKPSRKVQEVIEVDLHAGALLDTLVGLSKADILNYQIDTFRKVMDENLRNPGQKIIFIHGKGEGILRQALMKELSHRYKGHDVADASFREYGFGATQVTIRK